MIEISLIIPVYNVEKYISKCLNSVIGQTLEDFEAIIIDDGSTDRSGEICDKYSKLDSRFIIVHQENKGVSAARNRGIVIAKGEYIVFLDSDDQIAPDYLSSFLWYKKDIDLVIEGVINYDTDGSVHHKLEYADKEFIDLSQEDILESSQNKALNYVYSKRFSKDIIKKFNVRFAEDMKISEDTLFVAQYLLHCKYIQYSSYCYYLYRKYDEVTLSSVNDSYVQRLEDANNKIGKVLEQRFENITESEVWVKRRWSVYYYCIFYILKNDKLSCRRKILMLRKIFSLTQFEEFKDNLNELMNQDGYKLRQLIKTGNATMIVLLWSMARKFKG